MMKQASEEAIIIRSELSQPLVNCVLLNCGKYVMQLRDEKPDINEPGRWGLFGGYREMFELPERSVKRELREELGLDIRLRFCFALAYHNIFEGDISEEYDKIVLGEGQAYGSFTLDELCLMNTSKFSIRILTMFEMIKKEKSGPRN